MGGKVLQGKELSYNNLLDLDAAWRAAVCHSEPAVAIVKHLSPCGIASAPSLKRHTVGFAQIRFLLSAGSSPATAGRRCDGRRNQRSLCRVHHCPGFCTEALAILAEKKNVRLVEMADLQIEPEYELRSITRGVLRRVVDFGDPGGGMESRLRCGSRADEEWAALRFAWKACQHVKSNAIVFARGTATVGIGGGQPNRVDCVRIAVQRAGERAQGAVMASDAFFPFADSVKPWPRKQGSRQWSTRVDRCGMPSDCGRGRCEAGDGHHRRQPFQALKLLVATQEKGERC